MATINKQAVIEMVHEHDVQFIRLQFTDIFGVLKNVAITASQLEKALNGEMMFDGSSIEGFVRIEESDMYLMPDPDTFVIFPWRPREGAVARVICDVYQSDGTTPFIGDPRYALKQVLNRAAAMGLTMNVGPEAEFFLFLTGEQGQPTMTTHDRAGYFDLSPMDHGENARRDMVLTLQQMGYEIEASHHEVAPGQHEIDFKYADALRTADNIVTFKFVVRTIAQRHGLHASFMAKPIQGINGSGMHCNISLFEDGKNVFYDPEGSLELSELAYHFLAGILDHIPAITAITNPTVNSYKRLLPGYEAPVYIAWSARNRSPLVRIPAKRGPSTRLELRSPDPTCNPYLVEAVILQAGLDGIQRRLQPPPAVNQNIYRMSNQELNERGIGSLPGSLAEAMARLQEDTVIQEALGQHIYTRFVEAKALEWQAYRQQVTPWEREQYLSKY